jgi:DNA-binding MarR family transcriptional regulator
MPTRRVASSSSKPAPVGGTARRGTSARAPQPRDGGRDGGRLSRLISRLDAVDDSALQLGVVLEFMRLIWAIDHALKLRSKHLEAQLGVTGPQRLVIRMLGRFDRLSAGELASVLHMHPSTLTGILRRLERRKVLRRQADPEDGRRTLLSLTERGRNIDVPKEETVEWAVRKVLGKLSANQVAAAREAFAALAEELTPLD